MKINELSFLFKIPEEEQQDKIQTNNTSSRKEIINKWAEIHEVEKKKAIISINSKTGSLKRLIKFANL